MAGFYGADTDALRDVAGLFQERSRRLDELREELTGAVMREDIWIGGDGDSFRDRWTGVSSRFSGVTEDIARRREDLDGHAEEQDDASEAKDGGGLLDGIKDLLAYAKEGIGGLVKAYRSISKGIDGFKLFNDLQKLGKAGFEGLKDKITKDFIDELVDKSRKPAQKIMDFVNGKGWTRIADVAEGILDSGVVKGAGKVLGKALPVLDIGMGVHQMMNAEDGWDVAAGGLSVVSGGLMLAAPLAGPFAPIVFGAGAVAGGVSLAIDAGKAIVENWDSITETASDVWDGAKDVASDAWDGAKDVAGDVAEGVTNVVKDPIGAVGSLF